MTAQDLKQILFDGLDLVTGLEEQLWNAANRLRANSSLKASEYATPVLGLIFLKYASNKFEAATPQVEAQKQPWENTGKALKKLYIQECGFYLPPQARYAYLLEGQYKAQTESPPSLQKAIIEAMKSIEASNEDLAGTLPQHQYNAIGDDILESLLKEFSVIPMDAEGDLFGKIYEYFLGKFALAEGQKGGQFFTPTSVVKLIVEVIEPFKGKILDPSCGSGGMFVQSAKFIRRHQNKAHQLSVYGQERTKDTVNLAKMNLAVNGLNGDIRNVNSYYEDPFAIDASIGAEGHGAFDYVMANPPFNVKDVVEEKITPATRFNFYGLPVKPPKASATKKDPKKQKLTTIGNANYLWANLFGSALNPEGRAGFVMANSASDARNAELEVRKNIVDQGMVDVIVAVASNFFISVSLPITVWFYDKGKPAHRRDQTLFVDARHIYTQVDRATRTFTQSQLYDLTAIVWLYRGEPDKYRALIDLYQQALERWQQGTIANPRNADLPYQGLAAANAGLRQALEDLQQALTQWYSPLLQATLEADPKVSQVMTSPLATAEEKPSKPLTFVGQLANLVLEDLPVAYKTLQELVTFAERQLRPKKDKTFQQLEIKKRQKAATTAYEHQQFICERIAYFSQHLAWHQQRFPEGRYVDVEGLCKIANLPAIRAQDYSLNPGRYVGVALEEDPLSAEEFKADMQALHHQLLQLNQQAATLEQLINDNLKEVL